jgi:hypothetical protein
VDFTDYAHSIPNLVVRHGQRLRRHQRPHHHHPRHHRRPLSQRRATTSFYIDDTPLPTALDPRVLDLERIEVLRGPQGTLFGSSAMGGTVRLITKTAEAQSVNGLCRRARLRHQPWRRRLRPLRHRQPAAHPDELGLKFSAYNSYKPGMVHARIRRRHHARLHGPRPAAVGRRQAHRQRHEAGGMLTLAYTPAALPG